MACRGLAVSSLERVINRVEFTDEQLVELSKAVANAENLSAIPHALACERCRGIYVFKNPTILTPELVGRKMLLPAPILELYKALGPAAMPLSSLLARTTIAMAFQRMTFLIRRSISLLPG
jgi:hypothetical protein